jgi:arsenate reductase-like glutaredoxin family protein
MEVQIFGLKKNAETRKAIRFFSERRVRAHFVDLAERMIAEGEIQRFVQRFGIEGVLDRAGKRFEQLGLRHATMSEGRWVDKLLLEPGLLRLPLVRKLGQPAGVTVGEAEDDWESWIDSTSKKPS